MRCPKFKLDRLILIRAEKREEFPHLSNQKKLLKNKIAFKEDVYYSFLGRLYFTGFPTVYFKKDLSLFIESHFSSRLGIIILEIMSIVERIYFKNPSLPINLSTYIEW